MELLDKLNILADAAKYEDVYKRQALLIQSLKSAFGWIKAHYGIITKLSGLLLVLVGIMMATGTMGQLLTFLA